MKEIATAIICETRNEHNEKQGLIKELQKRFKQLH